jgi:hypothetical protein
MRGNLLVSFEYTPFYARSRFSLILRLDQTRSISAKAGAFALGGILVAIVACRAVHVSSIESMTAADHRPEQKLGQQKLG